MISHVRIRRLNVRVIARSAPWATREDLARTGERARTQVLAGLERILADALAGLPDGTQLGLLNVNVATEARRTSGRFAASEDSIRASVDAALERALREAAQRHVAERAARALPPGAEPREIVTNEAEPQLVHPSPAETLLALLLAWHAEERLVPRLALLSPALLRSWCDALHAHFAGKGGLGHLNETAFVASVAGATSADTRPGDIDPTDPSTATQLIALVTQLAEEQTAASSEPVELGGATALETIERGAHTASGLVEAQGVEQAVDAAARAAPAPASPAPRRTPRHAPTITLTAERARLPERAALASALPFLLLGPLARTDWLAAARNILAERATAVHAAALGFALAQQGLPDVVLTAELQHAAALAAGLPEPPDERVLREAERALSTQLGALDATLADALVRGHQPHGPLYLVGSERGLVLIDAQGLFPLAIGNSLAELLPVLRAVTGPLFVSASLRAVMAELDISELTYASSELDTAQLLRALGSPRRLADAPALDRTVTLAAAVALGELSWRLSARAPEAWAEPDPLLALERFGDLSGTMIVTRHQIEVRLPLGPRSRDLDAAGLLADVGLVPWLGQRRLRFGIG